MDESTYHFRNSLGGYHKGDVTAYIEKTATQHRSEILEYEKNVPSFSFGRAQMMSVFLYNIL